jgi:hypothetical protein
MKRRLTDPEVLREIPYVGDPKRSRVALQQAADSFVSVEPITRQRTLAFGILSSTRSPLTPPLRTPPSGLRLISSVVAASWHRSIFQSRPAIRNLAE